MRKKIHFRTVITALSIGVLLLAVASMIIMNFEDTNDRVERLTEEYIKNGTVQNTETLEGIFSSGKMSLDSIGKLYGEIEQKAENITSADIKRLTEEVWFDRLIFVDKTGWGFDGSGHYYNFKGSPNFAEAMKGNIGIGTAFVYNDSAANQLCFYAPVKDNDTVFGALLGYFNDETLENMLTTKYFGYDSQVFLCNQNGQIIASTVDIGNASSMEEYFNDTRSIEGTTKKELFRHMNDVEAYGFVFHTDDGDTQAYMMGMKNCDLTVLQMFPVKAIEELRGDANADNMKMAGTLFALFLIYVVAIIILARHRWWKTEQQRKSVTGMVGAITRMFDRFMLVDLDKDWYEYITEGENVNLPGVEKQGNYHDIVEKVFCECYDSGEKKLSMDHYFSIDRLKEALKNKDNLMYEYSEEFEGTDYRWTNLAVLCMERKDGEASKVLLASQDETKIKMDEIRSKDALREAYQVAENASRAKSDFLSKMSHDIRTPMNAIIGMTALAGSHIEERERVEDCLKKITVSSRHLLALINEVLDMSRIESGHLTLAEEEFNLSDLLETTLEMIHPSVEEKNQELSILIEDIEHENVIGDSLYVQKIITNIMSNAVKYTPEGGAIRVNICEKKTRMTRTGCFQFVFEDTGIGMSEEFLQRIFQPFERAEDSRIDKVQGTGLGMSIVKNVVQMMGGEITVESELNRGSRFTVTILLKLQETEEVKQECLADLHVLVADDEEMACVSVCNMLESLGMKSRWVLSGREAVQSVIRQKEEGDEFQAVILDWKMPDMNGIETAREIRKAVGEEIPVIIISAFDWSEIEHEAREAGVDAFISKPIFKSKLSATFQAIFDETSPKGKNSMETYREHRYIGKRALLVDDNEINVQIAKELLEMTGIEVHTAENGKEALDDVLEKPEYYYDILFLDIQMPVMNGYECCKALRNQGREDLKKVPVIAVTANAFTEDILNAKHAGMNQHLAKPIDIVQLQSILEKWLTV